MNVASVNFRSPLDSTEFDLYVLGRPPRFRHLGPVVTGFSGLNVPLCEARSLVQQRREDCIAVAVVPVLYRDHAHVHIGLEQATPIALAEFERCKASSSDSFGPLAMHADRVGWWLFGANNLTLQEQGCIPGVERIYVGKFLARVLDKEEREWVDRLTYG